MHFALASVSSLTGFVFVRRYAMEHHNLEKDIASDLKEQFELEFEPKRYLELISRWDGISPDVFRCVDL